MEPITIKIEPLNPLTEQEYEKLKEGLKKIDGFRFTTSAKITIENESKEV